MLFSMDTKYLLHTAIDVWFFSLFSSHFDVDIGKGQLKQNHRFLEECTQILDLVTYFVAQHTPISRYTCVKFHEYKFKGKRVNIAHTCILHGHIIVTQILHPVT